MGGEKYLGYGRKALKSEMYELAIRCFNTAYSKTIGHKKRDRICSLIEQAEAKAGMSSFQGYCTPSDEAFIRKMI